MIVICIVHKVGCGINTDRGDRSAIAGMLDLAANMAGTGDAVVLAGHPPR
ncbi:MAG: hypothetical protein NUV94_01330 [Candidatus Acetothermia bacterium]|nr:hypothetical protein [Candidatus Acetothermia bacterium]